MKTNNPQTSKDDSTAQRGDLNILVPSELTDTDKKINNEITVEQTLPETMMPAVTISSESIKHTKNFSYVLSYDISPNVNSLVTSEVSLLKKPEDFLFREESFQSTFYQIKSPVSLSSSLSFFSELFSLKNSLSFLPQTQEHPYISELSYPNELDRQKIIINDNAEKKLDLDNKNEIIIKPFLLLDILSSSTVNWSSNIKIIRTEYNGLVSEPVWLYNTPEWDKESFTEHNVGLNISAREGSSSQTLSLNASLPPLLQSYTGKLSVTFPFVSVSADSGYKQEEKTDAVTGEKTTEFVFIPMTESLNLSVLEKKISFTQSYKFDFEEKKSTSLQAALSVFGLRLSYSMQYTFPYELDTLKGWVVQEEKKFIPSDFTAQYTLNSKKYPFWKNRITLDPAVTTQLKMDLIRPTNTIFSFSPSLNFTIYEFLKISFSSESANDVMFRYMQDFYDYDIVIPGEKNIFKDLVKSFNFFNEVDRLTSGFKLKKLTLKVEHDLHDWLLKSEFSFSPRLKTDKKPYYYDFSPYFSISVVWNPMKSLKTQIVDEYGTFQLNP